jgi:hypothetical protein
MLALGFLAGWKFRGQVVLQEPKVITRIERQEVHTEGYGVINDEVAALEEEEEKDKQRKAHSS